MLEEIRATAETYFRAGGADGSRLLETTIREAVRASDEEYGIAAAVLWADGYRFPEELVKSDERCLQAAQLDFLAMVRRRLNTLAPLRLNRERASGLRNGNPERDLVMELATKGMFVPLPAGFKPNGKSATAPLRQSYLKVHEAVNRMLADTVQRRLAFLLPKDVALRYVPGLHLGTAHWAPKKGKASGRPIGDLSFVEGTPLNSKETTAAAEAHYGKIEHPTITDIIRMINGYWKGVSSREPTSRWQDLRIWKMDLRGAYTLLSFNPEDVPLFAMELSDNLVYLQFVGIFGWSCTPAAFQVITRALKYELAASLESATQMYVDDVIGVCMASHLDKDLVDCADICTRLLGPDAVAQDKTEQGTRLDIIGYVVDLHSKRVSIARKNFLNTLYGFLRVDLNKQITLKDAQRLASWASRYGQICRAMRPFCSALNNLTANRHNRHVLIQLTNESKIAIRLWRAMLYLIEYDEVRFTRPLATFDDTSPSHVVEFDASLTGVGILLYERIAGTEVCLGGGAIDIRGLQFEGDSSFQNTAEYIGAMVGILALITLGTSCRDLEVRGDSVAALTWAQTERARGPRVTNAAMVFTVMCLMYDLDVKVATHIPGVDNHRCDKLSRLVESRQGVREAMDDMGLDRCKVLDIQGNSSIRQLLELCGPTRVFADESEFIVFWAAVRESLRAVNPTNTV